MMVLHLIWLFAIGAFVYWMVAGERYRAHTVNRWHELGELGVDQLPNGERDVDHRLVAPKLIDPVCGTEVDPEQAAGMRRIGEHNVFFCSARCLEAFDENPDAYRDPDSAPRIANCL